MAWGLHNTLDRANSIEVMYRWKGAMGSVPCLSVKEGFGSLKKNR